jgi:Zn-dependent peptidase ImmA (M78 family)
MVSKGLKNPLAENDVFVKNIKVSYLKRIDKIFNKGLHYYLDPKTPEASKDASIFFRKKKFNSELNFGAKKIVNQFEEFKISLSTIAKLAELKIERTVPVYTVEHSAKEVAQAIREEFYPQKKHRKNKDFLKALIGKLAEKNVLVFEFVENHNLITKANIEGFFLNPNVIVLKRLQDAMSREIFTLAHELGHYLLNIEEIEKIDFNDMTGSSLSKVERWCNDFAYYFLVGEYGNVLDNLETASGKNDYHFDLIGKISMETHLSRLALFTRLLYKNQISNTNYNKVKTNLEEQYKARKESEKKQREREIEMGKKPVGSSPKAINSPLLISTIQTAFYEGIINEQEVCKRLNIKPNKLNRFIQ